MTEAEFSQEYTQNRLYVSRYALRQAKGYPVPIDELVADAWCKAWEKRHQFQGKAKFRTWVCTIARNEVMQYLRKRRLEISEYTEVLEDWPTGQLERKRRIPIVVPSIQDTYMCTQPDMATIWELLLKVPPTFRRDYILFYMYGFTKNEIAMCVNIARGTVTSNVSKARWKLRALLNKRAAEAR